MKRLAADGRNCARTAQAGMSLVGLLVIVIGLCAVLMYTLFGGRHSSNELIQRNTASQLVAQAQLIRQQILRCATEDQAQAYPASVATTGKWVSTLTCPSSGQSLWTGTDGTFMPIEPTGFVKWTYYNDSAGIRLQLWTVDLQFGPAVNTAAAMLGAGASALKNGSQYTLYVDIAK